MPHQKMDPEKNCKVCGVKLERKRFANGRLEDRGVFLRRHHCSQECANTKAMVQVETHRWRARKSRASECAQCQTTEGRLDVHHIDRNPANNDPTNLVTLCASCHLKRHWQEDPGFNKKGSNGGRMKPLYVGGKPYLVGLPHRP